MAAVSIHAGPPGLITSNPYLHNTSPHASSAGTNRDEPYIDSLSPSPIPPHTGNHAGPSFPAQYDAGMLHMGNTGRRASSPAALYQQGQMMSFAAPNHYSYGSGYGHQAVPQYGRQAAQATYSIDRPPLQNHSVSHSIGPSVPMWHQNAPTMQGRAAQNGMNASSFRRGSLGGQLSSQPEHGLSEYGGAGQHASLDFHHQFHHSTMYDTYQVGYTRLRNASTK